MIRPTIAVIRETSLLTNALVASYAQAQQIQIDRDFAPAWQLSADVTFVAPGQMIPAGAWQLVLLDHSDQADALGYHDDTGPGGVPRSKAFIADCLRDGLAWTVTAGHECLEMLGDPEISKVATVLIDGVTYDFAWENCDACEDDRFSYAVDGHHLSDFVLPSWFDPAGVAPFTFCRNPEINAPLTLATGGYIGRRETLPTPGKWSQVVARMAGPRVSKGPSSRTMRRFGSSSRAGVA